MALPVCPKWPATTRLTMPGWARWAMPPLPALPIAPQAQVVSWLGWPVARKWRSSPCSTSSARPIMARPPRKRVAPSLTRGPTWSAVMIFMGASGSGVFDQQRHALAAADAGGDDGVAATATLQFARGGEGQAHAGGGQRM